MMIRPIVHTTVGSATKDLKLEDCTENTNYTAAILSNALTLVTAVKNVLN